MVIELTDLGCCCSPRRSATGGGNVAISDGDRSRRVNPIGAISAGGGGMVIELAGELTGLGSCCSPRRSATGGGKTSIFDDHTTSLNGELR